MRKPRDAKPGDDIRKKGRKWLERVEAAGKLEKAWLDDARKASDAYTGDTTDTDGAIVTLEGKRYDFNILFANVETIVPAVINSPPAPDIRRRFGDADPVARAVAEILERAIRVQVDDSRLQIELEFVAHDAFLAGRGIPRIRFRSDIVGQGEPSNDEIEDAAESPEGLGPDLDPEGSDGALGQDDQIADPNVSGLGSPVLGHNGGPPIERVENERISFEAVSWIDYRHGPAKRWDERTWDAFRFCIPREEASGDFFDQSLIRTQMSDNETRKWVGSSDDLSGWEIWDKSTKTVLFIDDAGIILKTIPDPLGLSNFFCIPTPVQPIEINGRLMPVNPFAVYRKLANDLDIAVRRKQRLIEAMKAKGWYAGNAADMASIIDKDDNEFVPIADAEMWVAAGGIEKAIAFWPIDRFIVAIQQLDSAIVQYKQWIYEITGISDIVRGASVATETATAQNIKSQWGSLRIQKMQRMMERCARDLFVMMSEIIPTKFTLETLERMTGMPIIPQPNDPPEMQQQKLAVIDLLKQRLSSYYRIDVESDSTVRADLTRQKQEVATFLQGAGAYFASVGPLVKDGTIPADAAAEIFASNARLFNLGRSVEDVLEAMVSKAKQQAAQPQQPNPEQQAAAEKQSADANKANAEAEAQKQEMAHRQQEFEQKAAESARKVEADGRKAQHDAIIETLTAQIKQIEFDIKQVDLQIKQAELVNKATQPAPQPMEQMA